MRVPAPRVLDGYLAAMFREATQQPRRPLTGFGTTGLSYLK
ncbi:MAG: hypothetical protein N2C14_22900 [Planctomycetales bacterium]